MHAVDRQASRVSLMRKSTLHESLRKHIESKSSDATHWLMDSIWLQTCITCVVLLNVLQLGLSVELRGGAWNLVWEVTEYVFASIFFIEMCAKLGTMGRRYFADRWNLLDFGLAWLAAADAILLATRASEKVEALNNLTILRMVRLTRILRTMRVFRVCKELVIIMDVMLESLKTLRWLMVLITIMVYVSAILCVELVGTDDTYPSFDDKIDSGGNLDGFNNFMYFGTILRSMFSLFSLITLSEWSIITRPLYEKSPYMLVFMVAFAVLTAYGMMNVMVGVMVEQALEATKRFEAAEEAELKHRQMELISSVAQMLADFTVHEDGDGVLSAEDLQLAVDTNQALANMLMKMDLPSNC